MISKKIFNKRVKNSFRVNKTKDFISTRHMNYVHESTLICNVYSFHQQPLFQTKVGEVLNQFEVRVE